MRDQSAFAWHPDAVRTSLLRKYLDCARRRRLWILLITLGISLTTGVVALRLPNLYRAEAVVTQVQPQKVREGVVPPAVTGSIADRLASLEQEVMSPVQLGGLIKELHLYPKMLGKVSDQALIARMTKCTSIETLDSAGQRPSRFRIAFSDTDRDQVAPVANRLAWLFIERSQKVLATHKAGTSQLLDTELAEAKHELEEKERLVQEAKSRAIEASPESKQYHLEAVNRLREQLRRSQNGLNRDQQSKAYLQSLAWKSAAATNLDQPMAVTKSPYQAQLQKLQTQLKDMQLRYGPNYPDVRRLKNTVEELKAKADSEKLKEPAAPPPAQSKSATPNPAVEAELTKLDQEIAAQRKTQAELEKQIQYHVEKLQQASVFEQQVADLMRDYDAVRNRYNQLEAKKLDTESAGELETSERFEVLDQAVSPTRPVGPQRGFILGGGLLFGLLCGIGVAFLVEASDGSVRHEREAAQIFGKPVLAGIPKITSLRERMRSRWVVASITAGTAGAAVGLGLILSRFVS